MTGGRTRRLRVPCERKFKYNNDEGTGRTRRGCDANGERNGTKPRNECGPEKYSTRTDQIKYESD